MKGRKPTPTGLKLLRGNPGHRPIDTLHEPQATVGKLPEAPPYVASDAEALKFWLRQGAELVAMRTLAEEDWASFGGLCLTHSRVVWLTERINKIKTKRRVTEKDEIRLGTYESQRGKTLDRFNKSAGDFGITPASRTRIKIPHNDGQLPLPFGEPASPLTRILARERSA
jgi:phage terminase small subunit